VIEQAISEHERQMAWIEGAVSLMNVPPEQRQRSVEAIEQARRWIEGAGGFLGQGAKRPGDVPAVERYEMIKDARREPRQKVTLDLVVPKIDGLDPLVVQQFISYFREMAAVETIGSLLWEAPAVMPWEFYADTARHLWDEVRHSQAGQQRLEKLGLNIWDVPVQTGNYNIRARMPVLERYAYITQIEEKGSFPGKHENERRFRAAGDALSADMIAYDVADETAHVLLGVKWIPQMQKVLGDSRGFDQLVRDATVLREKVLADLRLHWANSGPATGY
jgi:hypothetical protein